MTKNLQLRISLVAILVIPLTSCTSNNMSNNSPKSNSPSDAPSSTASGVGATGPGAADPDAPAEFTQTDSGLKYKILRKSEGKKPTAASTVVAHYKGWLDDGEEFDSSYKRGEPTEFPLSRVIPGWTEGLQLVGKGGMIELEIPYQLGYGERGMPGAIPPMATLHFTVELIDIR